MENKRITIEKTPITVLCKATLLTARTAKIWVKTNAKATEKPTPGRYTRCSAATSNRGIKLEVGVRVIKNQRTKNENILEVLKLLIARKRTPAITRAEKSVAGSRKDLARGKSGSILSPMGRKRRLR